MRSESANGRLLIWKITGKMIVDRPLFGVGFDRFKSYYMTAQADYFAEKPDSPEAKLADDANYAFNDFLQHTAENGMIGLVLMLLILITAFRVKPQPSHTPETFLSFNSYLLSSKAGLAAVAVFAFFSYPAQVLPIKMSVILYLAFITSLSANQLCSIHFPKYIPVKYVVALLLAIGLMVTVPCLKKSRIAWKSWKEAHHLYTLGGYTGCLPHYEKAWPILKTDGDYLTNYGKALSMANEHQQAIEVLRQAVFYYPNIVVYTALGDSYKALGKTVEAEQAYLTAYYMNPSRFYAQYLLAKLYDETGQTEKATDIANELLQKEVKIPSVAIKEIKEEMRKMVEIKN